MKKRELFAVAESLGNRKNGVISVKVAYTQLNETEIMQTVLPF